MYISTLIMVTYMISLPGYASFVNKQGRELLQSDEQFIHKRTPRAMSLAKLGEAAIAFLVRGAREIPTPMPYYKEFSKPGTLQTAMGDFRSVAKTDNRKRKTPQGEDYYEGVIGDKKVRLILDDNSQNGNPTILLFNSKDQGMYSNKIKVVYRKP